MKTTVVKEAHPETPIAETPAKGPKNFWFLAVCVLFVVGVYVAMSMWENPGFGRAIPNLVQYSVIAISPTLLAIWLIFLSGLGRSGVIAGVLVVVGVVGATAATVESVEFDGDMKMTFHYRWEARQADRIAKHRALQEVETAIPTDQTREMFHQNFVIDKEDMPIFRGKGSEGIIQGPKLVTDWQTSPPQELWRIPVGEGYASMSVVGNRLVTIEQRGSREAIACYDVNTGMELWVHDYDARFYEAMGGLGPRSTPTIDNEGMVYTLGAEGDLCCLDLFDGKLKWTHNILKEHNLPNVTWAMSSSPLIIGEMVVVNAGSEVGQGLVAYQKRDGEKVWKGAGLSRESHTKNLSGYSTPVLVSLHGIEQILLFDGAGLGGYDIKTGQTIWFYGFENSAGVNVAQPILLPENQIFISASYNSGGALVDIDFTNEKLSATKVWTSPRSMRCKFTSPVLKDGFVYGLDEGILMCLEPLKNEIKWKKGRYGHGQILLSGDVIFVLSEQGKMVLVQANSESFEELASLQVLSESAKVWNPPVLVGNRVYVRDHSEMACYELPTSTNFIDPAEKEIVQGEPVETP